MGMASRPGSALSIHNSIGGTGETTLSLDFSDMASVSGHSHHEQSNGTAGTPPTSSSSSAPSSSTSQAKSHHRSSSSISSMAGVGAGSDQKRKRKRREMQPVKETIHSNELYNDPYVWKNNGNTIQKKTGCKSIYYKCSNSTAGCTVNKTVTEKEGGGYVTKYRGQHLDDCHRLKKAQMSSQGANGHRSMPKEQ
ncbi:MAG: hypothetical protein J3Q66DRAFT_357094 [Benniella sp.]|nr:MAG: hypothetical protein J3Q66DRAFT_357094 [Benniella sp.]